MRIEEQVKSYSVSIGNDPLLIQGAGGNISWKESNVLWIKASGTWLSDAKNKEIFISLDLQKTRDLINAGSEDLTSGCLTVTALRPSIETSLHALLPQRVVVHYHAVEVIAHAVQENARSLLKQKLDGISWEYVDYAKPGPELAMKVAELLSAGAIPDVIILGNHGLVIAGDSVERVDVLLNQVVQCCATPAREVSGGIAEEILIQMAQDWSATEYSLPIQKQVHQLAIDPLLCMLSKHHWVMYPDHAIFLGARAPILAAGQSPADFLQMFADLPPIVLVEGCGVLVHKNFSSSQYAMLACYLEVTSRLDSCESVRSLSDSQIGELLNWDAEKYRQRINHI